MVDDEDYPRAKVIVDEWNERQPEPELEPNPEAKVKKGRGGLGVGLLVGFLCGAVTTVGYYYSPITSDGIDYDWDGKVDETWLYKNFLMVRSEP